MQSLVEHRLVLVAQNKSLGCHRLQQKESIKNEACDHSNKSIASGKRPPVDYRRQVNTTVR